MPGARSTAAEHNLVPLCTRRAKSISMQARRMRTVDEVEKNDAWSVSLHGNRQVACRGFSTGLRGRCRVAIHGDAGAAANEAMGKILDHGEGDGNEDEAEHRGERHAADDHRAEDAARRGS